MKKLFAILAISFFSMVSTSGLRANPATTSPDTSKGGGPSSSPETTSVEGKKEEIPAPEKFECYLKYSKWGDDKNFIKFNMEKAQKDNSQNIPSLQIPISEVTQIPEGQIHFYTRYPQLGDGINPVDIFIEVAPGQVQSKPSKIKISFGFTTRNLTLQNDYFPGARYDRASQNAGLLGLHYDGFMSAFMDTSRGAKVEVEMPTRNPLIHLVYARCSIL